MAGGKSKDIEYFINNMEMNESDHRNLAQHFDLQVPRAWTQDWQQGCRNAKQIISSICEIYDYSFGLWKSNKNGNFVRSPSTKETDRENEDDLENGNKKRKRNEQDEENVLEIIHQYSVLQEEEILHGNFHIVHTILVDYPFVVDIQANFDLSKTSISASLQPEDNNTACDLSMEASATLSKDSREASMNICLHGKEEGGRLYLLKISTQNGATVYSQPIQVAFNSQEVTKKTKEGFNNFMGSIYQDFFPKEQIDKVSEPLEEEPSIRGLSFPDSTEKPLPVRTSQRDLNFVHDLFANTEDQISEEKYKTAKVTFKYIDMKLNQLVESQRTLENSRQQLTNYTYSKFYHYIINLQVMLYEAFFGRASHSIAGDYRRLLKAVETKLQEFVFAVSGEVLESSTNIYVQVLCPKRQVVECDGIHIVNKASTEIMEPVRAVTGSNCLSFEDNILVCYHQSSGKSWPCLLPDRKIAPEVLNEHSTVTIWNIEEKKCIGALKGEFCYGVTCLAIHNNLVAVGSNGTCASPYHRGNMERHEALTLWNLTTGEFVDALLDCNPKHDGNFSMRVYRVYFVAKNRILIQTKSGRWSSHEIYVMDIASKKMTKIMNGFVLDAHVSGYAILVEGKDGGTFCIDLNKPDFPSVLEFRYKDKMKSVNPQTLLCHRTVKFVVSENSSEPRVFSVMDNRTIEVWNLVTQSRVHTLECPIDITTSRTSTVHVSDSRIIYVTESYIRSMEIGRDSKVGNAEEIAYFEDRHDITRVWDSGCTAQDKLTASLLHEKHKLVVANRDGKIRILKLGISLGQMLPKIMDDRRNALERKERKRKEKEETAKKYDEMMKLAEEESLREKALSSARPAFSSASGNQVEPKRPKKNPEGIQLWVGYFTSPITPEEVEEMISMEAVQALKVFVPGGKRCAFVTVGSEEDAVKLLSREFYDNGKRIQVKRPKRYTKD